MTVGIFKKGMAVLAAIFPEKEIMADISWECLKDLSDEDFIRSIKTILLLEKQINKATNVIALIREKAISKEPKLPGEAWGEVMNQITSVGSYGSPVFSDDIIDKAVGSIGWRTLCMSTNIMVERAHFLKIYETYASRKKTELTIGKSNLLGQKALKLIENLAVSKKVK